MQACSRPPSILKLFIITALLVLAQGMTINSDHPLVRQESSEPEPVDLQRMTNNTNALGFPFQDYLLYSQIRELGLAFLAGANSSLYAPNVSVCFENALNLAQFDFELLLIKYMYGDSKNNVLNTTLFLQNVSDVAYVCLDGAENLYVFAMYKYELFGFDNTNVMLGLIQNGLGSILSINKLFSKIITYSETGENRKLYFEVGRIFRMLADFEPVILEDAGNPFAAAAASASPKLAPRQESSALGWVEDARFFGRPIVQEGETPADDGSSDDGSSDDSTSDDQPQNPGSKLIADTTDYDATTDFNFENFDFSFGLGERFPGFKYLLTMSGPFEFVQGIINGTQMLRDEEVNQCDRLLAFDLIENGEQIVNLTGTIVTTFSFSNTQVLIENVYNIFDDLLLATKITQKLHPIMFHCWSAGEHTYAHFYDILVNQNGYNPKTYIMNLIYNFGLLFEAGREIYLFFTQDPRGYLSNVHDTGYQIGLIVYLIITPGLAEYEVTSEKSQALIDAQEKLEENLNNLTGNFGSD